ncbi:MAG: hypothetical protein JSV54_09230, partial [Chloroflexota bacterium]
MNTKVIEKISKLKDDRVHGASWLALQAISTLNVTVSESQAVTVADFVQEIKTVAEELTRARPSLTSIANHANQFLHQIITRSQDEKNLDSMKSFA